MRPLGILARAGLLFGISLAVPVVAPAQAQYVCPDGYYYDPTYGCVPNDYLTGPPYYYVYPDFGFGFFYGGGWQRGHGAVPPPHGVFHGGPARPSGGGHAPAPSPHH